MSLIEAVDLQRTYQSPNSVVHALAGFDDSAEEGTAKVLTTLLPPTSGTARIGGVDVLHSPEAVKRVIGASGQYAVVDEKLTGFENLETIGQLYHLSRRDVRARIEHFDLAEAGNRPGQGFSGDVS